MNIQQRITILFTAVSAGILAIFMGIVYFSASQNRASEFYNILQKEAITKVNLLTETQLNAETLQTIYRNNREILYEVEAAIYNADLELIYHDAVDIDFVKETPDMLAEIQGSQYIQFFQEDWQVIGMVYRSSGQDYIITAAAYDEYGYNKLYNLRSTMLVTYFLALLLIFLTGKYFSKNALLPLAKMAMDAKSISANNLDLRLKEGDDEIGKLARTFNAMLERLEKSFESQKQFVSYLAHEFRTPLSILIGEIELSLSKERDTDMYRETLSTILKDAKKMAQLSESFLDLAKASYDKTQVKFQQIRVDECLIDASHKLQLAHADYKVELLIPEDLEEENITLLGNEYLLTTAFKNLLENGCKYSLDRTCRVNITFEEGKLLITFSDHGLGIDAEEIRHIFKPFFRGKNKSQAEGSGIGLYLVEKIISLHEGKVKVTSKIGEGTSFTVAF
ncbi:ATP-binding protein [Belliella kenyensis]|uniref:histidine kinase n=1 Tax=Belliella kenyensis TaxID=1472724 RepID=A0ABV8EN82_9BACT|nr:HAMP domain-containing sensor histidine kinase [Belliella kenyensis]MCH7401531.1 HAMP domain-containing histidine kinase [Belliella kenyensis]MDN3603189.1 HAMP domain-containing sensor histidine kinase [Belliella kenyensis]